MQWQAKGPVGPLDSAAHHAGLGHDVAQAGELLFDKILVKVGCQLYVLARGETLSEISLSPRAMLAMHRRARLLSMRNLRK